jgi:hypothetical protein
MDKSTLFAPACRSKTGAIRAKGGRGISGEDSGSVIEKCMVMAWAVGESICEHHVFFPRKKKNPPAQICIAGFRADGAGNSTALQF